MTNPEPQELYGIEAITQPETALFREHFESYANQQDTVPAINFIRGFHKAVRGNSIGRLSEPYRPTADRNDVQWRQIREPHPMHGIQLVKRIDFNVKPYESKKLPPGDEQILSQYGMTALSLVTAIRWHGLYHPTGAERALRVVGDRIIEQLQLTEADIPERPRIAGRTIIPRKY